MGLSGLVRLGKIAGIGGISIGAVVLLLHALIGTVPSVPADQRADIVRLIAILCFGVGVIGIVAWVSIGRLAGGTASTSGSQSPAVSAGGVVDISYAGAASERLESSRPNQTARCPSDAVAQTLGDQSPAVVSDADVAVRYGRGPSTDPKRKRK